MYDRPNLGLDEAIRGLQAGIAEAQKDSSEGRACVIAIVDHRGDLVAYARQDQCLEMSKLLAPRKAYTAAIGRNTSRAYGEFIKKRTGENVETHVGPQSSSSPGGLPILRSKDGVCIGGVGVSGAKDSPRDEEIGRIAIDAMNV